MKVGLGSDERRSWWYRKLGLLDRELRAPDRPTSEGATWVIFTMFVLYEV